MVINHLLAGKILQVVVGEGFPRIPHESWALFYQKFEFWTSWYMIHK